MSVTHGILQVAWLVGLLTFGGGCPVGLADALNGPASDPAPAGGPAAPSGVTPAADRESTSGEAPAERLVSVAAREADIRGVLLTLAGQAGLDIVLDPDVAGLVTLEVEKISLRQALEAIIGPTGFHYELTDGLLRVRGTALQTVVFTLNYVTGVRFGTTQLSASSGTRGASEGQGSTSGGNEGSGAQSSSSVNSAVTSNPWADILRGLETILFGESGFSSTEGPERLVVHPPSGVILVTASYAKLNRIADFLERIEGSVCRQVMIEARIVEVALRDEFHLGVDWSRIPGAGGIESVFGQDEIAVSQQLSPQNEVFRIAGSRGDFDGLLDALAEQGRVRVVSAPRVATLNNQKAIIKVAREESFFTQTIEYEYQPDGSRLPVVSVDPERITIGLILDVTPQISPEGEIMMHVHPSVTELVGEDVFPPGASGSEILANAPVLDIREVDTVVRIDAGKLLIIGGLMKERVSVQERAVPILGQIPILGQLFKRTDRVTEQIELVIVLQPEVVIGEAASALAMRELERLDDIYVH